VKWFQTDKQKTLINDSGLTTDTHIEGAVYDRPGAHRAPLQNLAAGDVTCDPVVLAYHLFDTG
jgi:hypothetical protein